MKTYKLRGGLWIVASLATSAFLLFSHHSANAQAVVQTYSTTGSVQYGMIVTLTSAQSNTVEPATVNAGSKVFGVAVNPDQADVTLSSGSGVNQAYVATTGTYNVLVSNQNGAINSGDYVTISSIAGIGMKADSTEALTLGKADAAFNAKSVALNTASLSLGNGKKTTVSIGEIPVTIEVGHNPLEQPKTADLPSFLQRFSRLSPQKPVNALRVYISIAVLAVTAVIVIAMLYSGVRTSITSVGRNPLSRKSIFRSLLQVFLISLIIFIVGLFAVYLLLKT
jgi:hypothetical protein